MKQLKFGRKRNSVKKYQPSRDTITQAIDQYLQEGGNITKIESMPETYENYIAKAGTDTVLADEFLQDSI